MTARKRNHRSTSGRGAYHNDLTLFSVTPASSAKCNKASGQPSSRSLFVSSVSSGDIQKRPSESRFVSNGAGWREVGGIAWAFLSALILLSLLSYEPSEDPLLNASTGLTTNWLGQIGLVFSSYALLLFGQASYLLSVYLFAGAVFALNNRSFSHRLFLVQLILAVVAGASLLNWWTGLDVEKSLKLTTAERGGLVGEALTSWILPYLGVPGTGIILGTLLLSLTGLIAQINPIQVLFAAPAWFSELIFKIRMAHADKIKRLELEAKRLEKERQRYERELRKSGNLSSTSAKPENRPEPRIIDTAVSSTKLEEDPQKLEPDSFSQKDKSRDASPERSSPPINSADFGGLQNTVSSKQPAKKSPSQSASNALTVADHALLYKNYTLPPLSLLRPPPPGAKISASPEELTLRQELLLETLAEFGINATRGDITRGATITRYEIYPAKGVRVDRITSLNRDIARAMKAESVNILAPIPGKDSVAIDLPNETKTPVNLRDLLESQYFRKSDARIPLALGKDVYGETLVADLAAMPHLLIAGTTGSGKSVCINCIILSLLYKFSPEDLRLILVDPKVVEMQCYNGLPHLVVPVVTDPKKVLLALRWVVNEMERRYELMARLGVRNITAYNAKQKQQREEKPNSVSEQEQSESLVSEQESDTDDSFERMISDTTSQSETPTPIKLPYIVVIIDELADLMQTAPKDVEAAIARIAQKARAAGIHLILATQTPRAQVITGVIKTNIPCRIAFQVPSSLDSRVILDDSGAENLLGKGDMLYLPPGSSKLVRAQGAFVSDDEVLDVVAHITKRYQPSYEPEAQSKIMTPANGAGEADSDEDEDLIERCIELVIMEKKASTSLLQRKLRLGYTRAARIMDILESRGIVGPENGAKAREVLVQSDEDV